MRKLLILLFFIPIMYVHAEYLLPYPGPMPGNKLYKLSRIMDKIQLYWHWGNIAKTNYYMELSDKYLVEAKTLFEYKQYLLAADALQRSDSAWEQIVVSMDNASREKKDIKSLGTEYMEEALVHQQSIDRLIDQVPEFFRWTPEKQSSTDLPLKMLLEESSAKRRQ